MVDSEAMLKSHEKAILKALDLYYMDERGKAAQYIYYKLKSGVIKVIKSTRVGATTSLAIESYLKKQKSLILTVQNQIIKDTIITGIIETCKIYGIKPPRIIHIPSNFECVHYLNKRDKLESDLIRCEKELKQGMEDVSTTTGELKNKEAEYASAKGTYNRFMKLKIVLRDETCGVECDYYHDCPCTKVLIEEADIIVMTYDKLVNVERVVKNSKKGKGGVNKDILEELKECKNIILDEAHELDKEPFNVSLDINKLILNKKIKSGGFKQLYNDENYKNLSQLIRLIYDFYNNKEIKEAIKQSQKIAKSEDYYKHHNKIEVSRPLKQEQNPKTKKLQDMTIFTAALAEIDELIISGDAYRYKNSSEEIDAFIDYANLFNEKDYVVTTDRIENELVTKIASTTNSTQLHLGEFLKEIQDTEDYRILINSATHGKFDYSKILKQGTEIVEIPFGKGGDPLKTNDRMKIFSLDLNLCTNSDLSNSIQQQMPRILRLLKWGIDEYGSEGCFYCTINKTSARLIERALKEAGYTKEIHVFRGKNTIGTACEARFGVIISAGYMPSNAKYYAKDKEEEKQKALIDAFSATIHAMTRIKDPHGKINSALIAIMKQEDLINLVKQSTHNGIMKAPEIFPCYSNNKINFAKIRRHMNKTKVKSETVQEETVEIKSVDFAKNPAENISEISDIDRQQSNSQNHHDSSNNQFFGLSALQYIYASPVTEASIFDRLDEREFSQDFSGNRHICQLIAKLLNEKTTFSDSDWKWHKIGKNPLVTELITVKNEIKVLGFSGLEKIDAKHIIEAINGEFKPLIFKECKNNTYSILIITVPISAMTAKQICNNILDRVFTNHGKALDLKTNVIPAYTSRKSAKTHGNNQFRLPMYAGEQVLREGKFTADFEDMPVTIHDLRNYKRIHDKEDEFLDKAFNSEKEEPESVDI